MLKVFDQCVENRVQLAGFWIGIISMGLWLGPIFSQLWENYQRQSSDALSIYFLLFWFAGDSANLIGAVLTGQLEIQILIGVYYILQDFALLSQYLYYTNRNRMAKDATVPSETMACLFVFATLSFLTPSLDSTLRWTGLHPSTEGIARSQVGSRSLLHNHFFNGAKDEAGYAIGSFSAISYFAGRVPQLVKNHRRGTTDGVSIAMFIIIVLANLTYGLSVILSGFGNGWEFILRHAPWLAGSLGCCFLDFCVILQAVYFDHWRPRRYETLEGINGDA